MSEQNIVLVVEPISTDKELTSTIISKHFPEVSLIHAHDGDIALELLARGMRPNLIILDPKLPRTDGFDVLNKMRSSDVTGAIPIIVFTSSDEPNDKQRSRELGATYYAVKPIDYETYTNTLKNICQTWFLGNTNGQLNG